MKNRYDYDIVVIGAGIAGFVSAVTANSFGRRVAIIEKRKFGGNCTNFTCIPSKALIRAAHATREALHLDRLNVAGCNDFDTSNVMSRIRSVVQSAYAKDLPETFREIGIDVLPGAAQFVDPNRIIRECQVVSAEKFIIAAGTSSLVPPIKGLADIDYLTNENLYDLEHLPLSLTILGGGVAGLEYASAFAKLGVKTTVVEMATRLLPMVDKELVSHLLDSLAAEGIGFVLGAKAESLSKEQERAILTYRRGDEKAGQVISEKILVSVGRKPELDGLLLEKAGVKSTGRGIITDDTLRTSARNIYACGDIAGPYQLASMAEYQGMIAGLNAVLPVKQRVDYSNNAYTIFTEPQIGYLGLTEEQARQKYSHNLKVIRFDYADMRRAMVDDATTGIGKFLLNSAGHLVGVHIVGEAAAEVIHEAQVIRALKKPLRKLYFVTHVYPTYSQALVGRASQLAYLDRMNESILIKMGLKLFPGLDNRISLARKRLAEREGLPPINPYEETQQHQTFDVSNKDNGHGLVIRLPDKLLDPNEEPFMSALSGNDNAGRKRLVLDFCNVNEMNGLGADMLVKLCARATMNGWTVTGCGFPEGMRDILKVTELDQAMDSIDNYGETCVGVPCIDIKCWAKPEARIVSSKVQGARSLNVNSRRAVGPVNGFGQLWQKIFRLYIERDSITPEETITVLKNNFPSFQPSFNRFYPSSAGIAPGEVVLIDSMTAGGPVSTGVMVLYADTRCFTFCCPQGHPESGFVTFSAFKKGGKTIVQVLGLARANDPLYEAAFSFIGSKIQGRIWNHLLNALAAYLGVPANVNEHSLCIDTGRRWLQAKNVWWNAQIRTTLREPVHVLKTMIGNREAHPG